METTLFWLAGCLVALGAGLLWWANRSRHASGLPGGQVIYTDMRAWQTVEKPLYDAELGLTGKPDYLIEQSGGAIIPVEVKSARAPAMPYDNHIFQLAAYCALVERTYGVRPSHGVLRYRDRTFEIAYTDALEQELMELLADMRRDQTRLKRSAAIDRSHNDSRRCAHCGYRRICDQRL